MDLPEVKSRYDKGTLGYREDQIIARDKKLQEDADKIRLEQVQRTRKSGRRPRAETLLIIQQRGKTTCCDCGKEKQLKHFYTYYNSVNELVKIFPDCKKCNRRMHRSDRGDIAKAQRKSCLEHYGKAKAKKLHCFRCKCDDFESLVLFDLQHKNEKAIVKQKTYKKLCDYNYPDIRCRILCFNCAHKRVRRYTEA